MRSRATAALAALVLAFGAAACGGDDDDGAEDFKRDYRAESAQIEGIGQDIAAALTRARKQSDAAVARTFGGLARRARGSVDDLKALDPPEELADERDVLVRALRTGAADLGAIEAAGRASDPAKARRATVKLIRDSAAIRDARNALDRVAAQK